MTHEESIFVHALELATPVEQQAYVERACAGNRALKEQVQALLHAHNFTGSILDGTPPPIDLPLNEPDGEGAGAQVGPYKLLELIGEGGMGLVYMARQEQPIRRTVALKILKPGMDTRQVLARFQAERHALSLLDHPGIARVLDAGTAPSGRPYFVMELVRGISINQFCDEAQLDIRQRLELFVRVCQAVQHAHGRGIIHRDLKPANILVTVHDEVPVPKVIDFGIAKATQHRLVDQTLFTNFLQMIGTPAYMSPEQAQLSSLEVDARSDVYSLGVLLYELLTGVPPFESDRLRAVGYVEAQRIIREEEPARPSTRVATLGGAALSTVATRRSIDPRRYAPSLRGDLDWIVMKALEKDRNRRYESAAELAEDVRRHLQSVPVRARRTTTGYRLRKFLWRQRTRVMLAAVAVAVGTLALGAYLLHDRAQKAGQESIRQLAYIADIQRAAVAVERGRLDQVASILATHVPQKGTPDLRGFEWQYLSNLCAARPQVLDEHPDQVFDVAWSASGAFMATSSGDYTVIVRDGVTGTPLQTLDEFPNDVNSATFLRDESILAVAEETGEVSIWDWRKGQAIQRLSGFDYPVARVFLTPDPDIVVVTDVLWGSDHANSSVWRLSNGECLSIRRSQRTLAVAPQSRTVAHRDYEMRLGLGSTDNLEGERLSKNHERFYEAAAFSPDGHLLAAGAADGSVEVWHLGEAALRIHVFSPASRIRSVAFSPDGRLLAAGGSDGVLRICDLRTLQEKYVLRPDRGTIWSCAFSPDGSRLAMARDRGVEIYELADLPPISRVIATIGNGLKAWAFNPSRDQLAFAWIGKPEVAILDAATGERIALIAGTSSHWLSALAFAPDGRSLWIGGSSGGVCRFDLDTMTEAGSFQSAPGLTSITISSNGKVLATTPDLNFWDTETLRQTSHVEIPDELVHLRFRRVGGFLGHELAMVELNEGIQVICWDFEKHRVAAAPFAPHGQVLSVAVSPDGSLLAFTTSEPAIRLWDAMSGQTVQTLLGHRGIIEQVAFSPNGRTLASCAGGDVRLWHVATGQQLMQLPLQHGRATLLTFSGDGSRLIFVGSVTPEGDEGVVVWGQSQETRVVEPAR